MAENQVGEYAQDFKGKETNLTKDQKALITNGVDYSKYTKSSDAAETYQEKYDSLKAEIDSDTSWNKVEKIKKEKELKQLDVQRQHDEAAIDLYGMDKDEVNNFITGDPEGKAYADKLLAYGDALVAAGLTDKNKFRDKYGNPKFDSSKTSSKSSKGKKGGKGSKGKSFDYKLYGFGKASSKYTGDLQNILEKYIS
jgi:hypothetical protein